MKDLLRTDMYRLLALGFDTPHAENLWTSEMLGGDLLTTEAGTNPEGVGRRGCTRSARSAEGTTRQLSQPLEKLLRLWLVSLRKEHNELEGEYQTLFGTTVLCPFSEGSYHLSDRGPIVGDVTAFYRAFHLEVQALQGPPDSIKMELAFMHWVALKKIYAAEQGMTEAFQTTADAERKFFGDHLGRWAPPFLERLREQTQLTSYRTLAQLLQEWLEWDGKFLDITPHPLPRTLPSFKEEEQTICS